MPGARNRWSLDDGPLRVGPNGGVDDRLLQPNVLAQWSAIPVDDRVPWFGIVRPERLESRPRLHPNALAGIHQGLGQRIANVRYDVLGQVGRPLPHGILRRGAAPRLQDGPQIPGAGLPHVARFVLPEGIEEGGQPRLESAQGEDGEHHRRGVSPDDVDRLRVEGQDGGEEIAQQMTGAVRPRGGPGTVRGRYRRRRGGPFDQQH